MRLSALLVVSVFSSAAWALADGGDLDTSFNGTGILTLSPTTRGDIVRAVAVQSDNKIILAGGAGYEFGVVFQKWTLARLNEDGSLDTDFGEAGYVRTFADDSASSVTAVAVLPEGKLVAAGSTCRGPFRCYFALARYNADGSLDKSFGTDGTTTLIFGDLTTSLLAMALQPDGSIVTAGFAYSLPLDQHFALARFTADGVLDTSFGQGGSLITEVGWNDVAFGVAIQEDGKIVAGGYANASSRTRFAAVRYNADGSLDSSFGRGGIVTTAVGNHQFGPDAAYDVALQADQKIILAGQCRNTTRNDFCLVRYATDGSLDPTFGDNGKVFTTEGNPSYQNRFSRVVIQPDQKIVAVGAYGYTSTQSHFAVGRYNSDGSLDPDFNRGKLVVTPVSSNIDEANAVSLDTVGRLVVAGMMRNAQPEDWAVARYLP